MAFRRKTTQGLPTSPNRFDKMPEEILYTALESSLQRTAELFRGLEHKEVDPAWILSEMALQVEQASQVIAALQRRVDLRSKVL